MISIDKEEPRLISYNPDLTTCTLRFNDSEFYYTLNDTTYDEPFARTIKGICFKGGINYYGYFKAESVNTGKPIEIEGMWDDFRDIAIMSISSKPENTSRSTKHIEAFVMTFFILEIVAIIVLFADKV